MKIETRMIDDEKLISMVRQYPVLYDVNHAKYLDYATKLKIWKMIANEVGTDDATVKSRWNNMRDTYRKNLRKLAANMTSNKIVKRYKYSEQLSFMKDYFTENTKGTTPLEADFNFEDLNEITDEAEDFKLDLSEYQVGNDDTQSKASEKSSCKRKRNDTTTEMLMKYILKKESNQSPILVHPVDAFLCSLSPTLKTLNPYLLNLAKSELFATVQKYELEMLKQTADPIATNFFDQAGASVASMKSVAEDDIEEEVDC